MCDAASCSNPTAPLLPDAKRRVLLRRVAALPLAVVLAAPMLAHAAGRRIRPTTIDTQGGKASGIIALPSNTPWRQGGESA